MLKNYERIQENTYYLAMYKRTNVSILREILDLDIHIILQTSLFHYKQDTLHIFRNITSLPAI